MDDTPAINASTPGNGGDLHAGPEAPSGKDAAYENFPVGSWLLPAHLRPHIAKFYRFARAIDDIADSPILRPEEKLERLDGFAEVLQSGEQRDGFETALLMRDSLHETAVTDRHCLDLISAFKQDATKRRYRDWDDLIDYCNRSAAPVGRYLLDLHGEDPAGYRQSDALCNLLQVLNHLQDCKEDYLLLDRVYIPAPWFDDAGLHVNTLADRQLSGPGRRLIDRVLDEAAPLLHIAAELPLVLKDARMCRESAVIVRIAHRLAGKLRRRDTLAVRVALSKVEYAACFLGGVIAPRTSVR